MQSVQSSCLLLTRRQCGDCGGCRFCLRTRRKSVCSVLVCRSFLWRLATISVSCRRTGWMHFSVFHTFILSVLELLFRLLFDFCVEIYDTAAYSSPCSSVVWCVSIWVRQMPRIATPLWENWIDFYLSQRSTTRVRTQCQCYQHNPAECWRIFLCGALVRSFVRSFVRAFEWVVRFHIHTLQGSVLEARG